MRTIWLGHLRRSCWARGERVTNIDHWPRGAQSGQLSTYEVASDFSHRNRRFQLDRCRHLMAGLLRLHEAGLRHKSHRTCVLARRAGRNPPVPRVPATVHLDSTSESTECAQLQRSSAWRFTRGPERPKTAGQDTKTSASRKMEARLRLALTTTALNTKPPVQAIVGQRLELVSVIVPPSVRPCTECGFRRSSDGRPICHFRHTYLCR